MDQSAYNLYKIEIVYAWYLQADYVATQFLFIMTIELTKYKNSILQYGSIVNPIQNGIFIVQSLENRFFPNCSSYN